LTTDADHIVPKRKGGKDTMDNLQGTCHSCHSMKTARGE
jgi:5-methylcytosine-specific restriction endonuclease McrA